MKILYYTEADIWTNSYVGIRKKIFAQISCFYSNNMDVYLVAQRGSFTCYLHGEKLLFKTLSLCMEDRFQEILKFIKTQNIQFVYIRNIMANQAYISFLRRLKELGIGRMIEYPTIPYDKEFPEDAYVLKEDQYYRRQEKRYVPISTNYNGLSKVYGIPSIQLANGINLLDIPLRRKQIHSGIVLLAVATMNYAHGYDRLIQGLAAYYHQNTCSEEVRLYLVGDGPEVPRYKKMAQQNNIDSYIEFCGILTGNKLTEVFNKADIAIGSLGLSRLGEKKFDPIKTKEYCARGIPFVIGYEDLSFQKQCAFVFQVPINEEPIIIPNLLDFYNKISEKIKDEEIRQYAEANLTWEIILRPVIDYIINYI